MMLPRVAHLNILGERERNTVSEKSCLQFETTTKLHCLANQKD